MHRLPALVIALIAMFIAVVGYGPNTPAEAATTRVWTGAVDLKWSTAGNWNPPGAPVNGDSVLIGTTVSANPLDNNIPNLTLASLAFGDFVNVGGNALAISNSIQVGAPNVDVILDLPISLAADTEVTVASGSRLFIRDRLLPLGTPGIALNGYTLTKFGPGEIEFDGDLSGIGSVAVQTGELSFVYPVSFTGTLSLASGTRALMTYLPFEGGHCGSAPNAKFTLNNGKFSVACSSVAIDAISGTGEIEMFSEISRLVVAGDGTNPVFDGNITGTTPSMITCCSSGSETFRGASSYTGLWFVDGGSMTLEGATFPAAAQFTVQGAGVSRPSLAGYGTFGETIITTGNLILDPINGAYGFARFPTLQFAPDVGVNFEIEGPTAGVGFTQILMSGQLVLDSALLRIDFGAYDPPVGQSFTLVYGATAVLDTFRDFRTGVALNEGSILKLPGPVSDSESPDREFSITYKGGAGHDVVLTRLAGPPVTPTVFKRFLPMVARDR